MTTDRQTEKTDRPMPDQILSPRACGTCKQRRIVNKPALHDECLHRAVLARAPGMPIHEDLLDLTYTQRRNLPARFHIPVWDGLGKPNAWLCAVCWDDEGVTHRWPCERAMACGGEVFEK